MSKHQRKSWESAPLGSIIQELVSGVSVNGEDRPARPGEPGILKVSAVSAGRFYPQENKAIVPSDRGKATLSPRKGDLLISRANTFALVGSCGLVQVDHPHLFLPDKLWRVVLRDPRRDDMLWLFQVLNSPSVREELAARATGTSGSMKNISKDSFLGIKVYRPPFPDQQHIAKMLDQWDQAAILLADLIELKRRLKSAIAHLLFLGKRRFVEFSDFPRREVTLREVTAECSERNIGGKLGISSVKGVTKAEGMVPMKERIIGASLDRYKVVRKNWFAYNPMRLNIGSIARWNQDEDVLVSPDYVVFRCLEEQSGPSLSPDFLDQVRRSAQWEQHVSVAGNGSVRIRIYYGDLARFVLQLPTIAEQRRIAALLSRADLEISLLNRQLDAVHRQKMGLMRKLLSGFRAGKETTA